MSQEKELFRLLNACRRTERKAQKELYRRYYAYGMTICLHYSKNKEEAQEILNDGFVKVFTHLHQYNYSLSFKGWLRKVFINTAIDYFRRNHRQRLVLEVLPDKVPDHSGVNGFNQLALDELMAMIQNLPPRYRLVFNLYILEGYKHEEIAKKLGITVGASKSNLSRAKAKLRQMLEVIGKKSKYV